MLPGTDRWKRLGQQVKSWFESKAIILMYHRVADILSDPWSLCVKPQHFSEHLQIVRSQTSSLQKLSVALQKGNLCHRSIVITFDDGYADNFYNAKPLLERWDVPVTVFLVAGGIGSEREFWWDRLERLLLQPGNLPDVLHLCVDGSEYRWELGDVARYSEASARLHGGWRSCHEVPTFRQYLYRTVWKLLRPLQETERQEILNELELWAGVDSVARKTHRPLSLEDLHALARGGLMEIGAHSCTHPNLAALSVALQQDEIRRSKSFLEEILGHRITSFAYPYGCYTKETVAFVQEAGFACACSTVPTLIKPGTDRFQLPRFQVQDWNGEEFERQLSIWMAASSGEP